MKKIICILLSLAMMIGMTMPAYAESGLKVTTAISTDKTVYEPGEDIDVSLVLSNEGDKNAVATVEFSATNFVSADMKSDEIVVRADSSTTRKYGASASYFEYDSGMGFQKAMDVVISFFVTSFYRMVAFFSSEKECVKIKIDNISAVIIVKTTVEEAAEDEQLTWTTEEVIDYYKKAAVATEKAGCKSKQTMSLQSLDGGEGFVGAILSALEGAGKKALEKNSNTYDGLTGGHEKLTVSDVKSATAKLNGDYIIVNIVPKDQTDGIKGNSQEGTVGHLVSVLDSVATAIEEMGLQADIPDGSVTLFYNNAYAKDIKINASTGKIESGKWGYTVNASINGMKILGVTLRGVKAVISYSVELVK